MPITEADRHRLFEALEAALGPEEAATLMEHLPPVGWADVATKRDLHLLHTDLDHLRTELETRIEMVDQRIEGVVHREITAATNRFVSWMVGLQATTIACVSLLKVFG